MASKESQELLDLYRRINSTSTDGERTLHDARRVMEHLGDAATEPEMVDYLEADADGVRAMWAIPRNCSEDRVVLCAHGGGFFAGSMYSHRKMYAHYAKAIGCRALIVHFGRPPENPHPVPVNDMATVYGWLLRQGFAQNHIAIAGDSAGGGLAITTMLRLRQLDLPLPAAAMPHCPWVDMNASGGTFDSNKENDVLVSREIIQMMASMFLGGHDRNDPLASPVFGDLHDLPPVYIQVGSYDALLDDSRTLAEKLKQDGVDVLLEEFPEMQHMFHLLAGTAPEADEAIRKLATWVRPKLGLDANNRVDSSI